MTIDLADPTSVALHAARAFTRADITHALYGGLLLAAYGRPRETRDADLAVIDANVEEARAALKTVELDASVSLDGVEFGGLLLSRIAVVGGGVLNTVDLIRPRSDRLARVVQERAILAPLRQQEIRVVSPEDYLLLKVLSTRDADLDDAASVFQCSRDALDFALLAAEVEELERELPDAQVKERWIAIANRAVT